MTHKTSVFWESNKIIFDTVFIWWLVSTSVSVFGVSAESMQCSYDRNGNSVPTILLLLQKRLYDLGGLKVNMIYNVHCQENELNYISTYVKMELGLMFSFFLFFAYQFLVKAGFSYERIWIVSMPTLIH